MSRIHQYPATGLEPIFPWKPIKLIFVCLCYFCWFFVPDDDDDDGSEEFALQHNQSSDSIWRTVIFARSFVMLGHVGISPVEWKMDWMPLLVSIQIKKIVALLRLLKRFMTFFCICEIISWSRFVPVFFFSYGKTWFIDFSFLVRMLHMFSHFSE